MSVRTMGMALVAASVIAACSKGPDPAVGRANAAKAVEHVNEGRGGIERLTRGFTEVMTKVAREMGPAVADTGNVARVRNRLLHDMHDDRTEVGRDLTLYPTWFIAAVGADGKGIAGDRAPEQDFIPGRDLGAAFPCVRAALQGTGGTCVGEMSSGEGQAPRVYLVSAQPTRATEGGAVTGAVVGTITYGRLAKAVRELLNLRVGRDRVQLYVGFSYGGRIIPSGTRDNDVAAAYLVPDTLLPRVPRDLDAKVSQGNGSTTFTFDENGGQTQWGAAAGRISVLGDHTSLLVFRTRLGS
ncbi:MAG: hypothetical protein U0326_12365 [Polyangiales bacterium]